MSAPRDPMGGWICGVDENGQLLWLPDDAVAAVSGGVTLGKDHVAVGLGNIGLPSDAVGTWPETPAPADDTKKD